MRTETVELRVTAEEKNTVRKAAEPAGLALLASSRMLLLLAARTAP
jgi:uncharacterized protein (DUF1778 family)